VTAVKYFFSTPTISRNGSPLLSPWSPKWKLLHRLKTTDRSACAMCATRLSQKFWWIELKVCSSV